MGDGILDAMVAAGVVAMLLFGAVRTDQSFKLERQRCEHFLEVHAPTLPDSLRIAVEFGCEKMVLRQVETDDG